LGTGLLTCPTVFGRFAAIGLFLPAAVVSFFFLGLGFLLGRFFAVAAIFTVDVLFFTPSRQIVAATLFAYMELFIVVGALGLGIGGQQKAKGQEQEEMMDFHDRYFLDKNDFQ
jgi:hypothetical protein